MTTLYSAPSVAALLAASAARARRASAQDLRSRPTLWLQGVGGTWHAIGAEDAPGRRPEQLNATADLSGPATASFAVRRDPRIPWADMHPMVPALMEIDGVPVWSGQVTESPRGDGVITCQMRGWQSVLDEALLDKWYVHQDWGGWHDLQSRVATYPTGQRGGSVTIDGAGAFSTYTRGTDTPAGTLVGVELDLGPGRAASRFSVRVATSANDPNIEVYVRGADLPAASGGGVEDIYGNDLTTHGAGPTYRAGTFATPRRYLQLFLYYVGAVNGVAADYFAKFTEALVFADAAYESGNASALTAPDVIRDVRAAIPELANDDTRIDPDGLATFVIHHLAPQGYSTARELIQAAASYYRWRTGVDAQRRLFFLPYPTTARYAVGDWPGCDISGVSPAAGTEVYNRVAVEGQTPDGETLRTTRSAPSPILDRLGRTRWGKLTIGVPVGDVTDLEFIGDAWLAERARTPLKGEAVVTGYGLRDAGSGHPVHASRALLAHGERARIMHLLNPDTGGLGIEGIVTGIAYDDDGQRAVLTLDDDAKRLDYLLARVGAQVSA